MSNLRVLEELAFEFPLLAPLDLAVVVGGLAGVLPRHVPAKRLAVFKYVAALLADEGLLVAGVLGVALRRLLLLHAFLEQPWLFGGDRRLRIFDGRAVEGADGLLLFKQAGNLLFYGLGLGLKLTEVVLIHGGQEFVRLLQQTHHWGRQGRRQGRISQRLGGGAGERGVLEQSAKGVESFVHFCGGRLLRAPRQLREALLQIEASAHVTSEGQRASG